MNHKVVSRIEWLDARKTLLSEEKALTRRADRVTQKRMDLPWVRLDKDYRFATEKGDASLADLFEGRSQLLVYHFMFGPDYKSGCPSCSAIADGFDGTEAHLRAHDISFWTISRAPLVRLLDYRERMGWNFPWASSLASDFNFDFGVSFTVSQQREGIEFNYAKEPPVPEEAIVDAAIPSRSTPDGASRGAEATQVDIATYARERPGMSAFVLEDGAIYHTYSAFSRGLDAVWSIYRWLDRAPKGRNETGYWWRRHDEYEG